MRLALKLCDGYFNKVLCYTQGVLCNASGINVRGYFNQVLYYRVYCANAFFRVDYSTVVYWSESGDKEQVITPQVSYVFR